MNEKHNENLVQKLKFRLFFESHLDFDEIDFDALTNCYNKLLELDGFSLRVTKEQCENHYRQKFLQEQKISF